jgi:hypothetical protein
MDFYQYYDNCTTIPSSYYDGSLLNFNQALELVGANHSFLDFKLDITEEEKLIFEQLNVNSTSRYEQFLPSANLSEFQHSYTEYLKSIGNTDKLSSYTASILARLFNNYMTQMHTSDTLIFGSSWAPTFIESPIFWHMDNQAEDESGEYTQPDIRVAITLMGPGTMFCDLEDNHRSEELDILNSAANIYNTLDENASEDSIALALNNALANLPPICSAEKEHKIHQPDRYSGTIFVGGKAPFATIHSVPTMTTERIFIFMSGEHPNW